jgi:hypothetical protein
MKEILILIGGWHFPYKFYEQISKLKIPNDFTVKKFVVSHRDLDLQIVYDEKQKFILENEVNRLDKELYCNKLSKHQLNEWGIEYKEYPNVIGDFYFIDQYFTDHTNIPDYLFFFHDDNYITNLNIISDIVSNTVDTYYYLDNKVIKTIKNDDWIHLANCFYENRFIPRGSFNVFKKDLLLERNKYLKFDNVSLTRNNEVISPDPDKILELRPWDMVCRNFGEYMVSNNLTNKSYRLSPTRRISKYLLECQRGFLRNLN